MRAIRQRRATNLQALDAADLAAALDVAARISNVLEVPSGEIERIMHRVDVEDGSRGVIDRAYQLANTVRLAVLIMGSRHRASAWFTIPNTTFGGLRPFDLLESNAGIRKVRNALCQTREVTR